MGRLVLWLLKFLSPRVKRALYEELQEQSETDFGELHRIVMKTYIERFNGNVGATPWDR